ncbi:hypothetical protein NSK_004162 [Nannochloropsis salina CCMP1776]|uniref:Uncharacterized protein n=1 Tax=Nannochloropsis salina CCMP1776 TaxID=1027361 RepID=A0A4D9D7S9_9STRA|nr:hypothetical protein NSK_004162 [Nannochloropsis salina CCMP1776]|eukprot:TFJ84698.1 hypothetical protein NSK_004162 [Nannochloropsis salina CCMP1776]
MNRLPGYRPRLPREDEGAEGQQAQYQAPRRLLVFLLHPPTPIPFSPTYYTPGTPASTPAPAFVPVPGVAAPGLFAGRNASGSVVDRAGIERHGSGQKRNGLDAIHVPHCCLHKAVNCVTM